MLAALSVSAFATPVAVSERGDVVFQTEAGTIENMQAKLVDGLTVETLDIINAESRGEASPRPMDPAAVLAAPAKESKPAPAEEMPAIASDKGLLKFAAHALVFLAAGLACATAVVAAKARRLF